MADDSQKPDGERLKVAEMERILQYSRMIIRAMTTLRIPQNDETLVALKLTALAFELGDDLLQKLPYEECKAHIEFFLTDLRGERR